MNMQEELNKKKVEAEVVLEDEEKTNDLVNKAEKKFNSNKKLFSKGGLKDLLVYIPLFIKLVKSYVKKEYKAIPTSSIIAIVAMLIYFMTPIDIIPDFVPGIGYIDDAALLAFVLYAVKGDLDDYQLWLENNNKQ